MIKEYGTGDNAEAMVPYTQGKILPVDATVISPENAYADPSQTAKPVAMPRIGAIIAAALLCRRQRIANAVGNIPGQVMTPVVFCFVSFCHSERPKK